MIVNMVCIFLYIAYYFSGVVNLRNNNNIYIVVFSQHPYYCVNNILPEAIAHLHSDMVMQFVQFA